MYKHGEILYLPETCVPSSGRRWAYFLNKLTTSASRILQKSTNIKCISANSYIWQRKKTFLFLDSLKLIVLFVLYMFTFWFAAAFDQLPIPFEHQTPISMRQRVPIRWRFISKCKLGVEIIWCKATYKSTNMLLQSSLISQPHQVFSESCS